MSDVEVTIQEVPEDVSPWLFKRVVNAFGEALVPADVDGVTLNVFDLDDPDFSYADSNLDPSTTYNGHQLMADPLVMPGWTQDEEGYNFVYRPDATQFPGGGTIGGHVMRYEAVLDLAEGGTATLVWVTPIKRRASG